LVVVLLVSSVAPLPAFYFSTIIPASFATLAILLLLPYVLPGPFSPMLFLFIPPLLFYASLHLFVFWPRQISK
jgi:hypothetical protein